MSENTKVLTVPGFDLISFNLAFETTIKIFELDRSKGKNLDPDQLQILEFLGKYCYHTPFSHLVTKTRHAEFLRETQGRQVIRRFLTALTERYFAFTATYEGVRYNNLTKTLAYACSADVNPNLGRDDWNTQPDEIVSQQYTEEEIMGIFISNRWMIGLALLVLVSPDYPGKYGNVG